MKTKLQEARIKKGLSQEQVAEMVGMTQPTTAVKKMVLSEFSNLNGSSYPKN